jgi:selenocysteine lyase/cysteine desulfurase
VVNKKLRSLNSKFVPFDYQPLLNRISFMPLLPNKKHLFDIPSDVTFLNCSYMSPMLNSVKQSCQDGLTKRSSPWKLKSDDWFRPGEELRVLFASLIHAESENIALTTSASYGLAVAAKNIKLTAGQKIVLLDQQYPSNVYPWQDLAKANGAQIVTTKKESGQTWTDAILQKIDDTTGLVAIPNCHWTDGSLINLEEISKATKKTGAILVIDASQSLGAYPLDVKKIKPDFLVSVGYKWLLGPYGLGYFYCDQKYCETGNPIENSWLNRKGSEDFTRLVDYQNDFRPGARRFDAGGFPDFIRVPMAIAALKQVLAWGIPNIQETISGLTDDIERMAKEAGLETPMRENRVGHMIGIKIPDGQITTINKKLADNNVYVSFRGTNMRVAPHLYNDVDDVKRLFQFLQL